MGKKEDKVEYGVRVMVSEPITNKKYRLLEYQATSESPLFKVRTKNIHLVSSNFNASPLVPNPAAYLSSSILAESSSSQAIQNSQLRVRDTERDRVKTINQVFQAITLRWCDHGN